MFGMKCKTQRDGRILMIVLLAITSLSLIRSSAATTYSSIQKSKWSSCTKCAGKNGNGSTAIYSQTTYVSSPSISGASSKFHIGGTKPYASALWWKQLGANSAAHNFRYDAYFYLENPSAAQALEFDVNQSVGGHKYTFGTECDIKGSHTWRVWSAATSWVSTGIPCATPSAYTWHHLTLQLQRTSTNRVKFISVTLDGNMRYINRTYAPKSSSVNELNVAFQMDGDGSMTDYDTWLDKVSLTAW
jgi:hypothetical protein